MEGAKSVVVRLGRRLRVGRKEQLHGFGAVVGRTGQGEGRVLLVGQGLHSGRVGLQQDPHDLGAAPHGASVVKREVVQGIGNGRGLGVARQEALNDRQGDPAGIFGLADEMQRGVAVGEFRVDDGFRVRLQKECHGSHHVGRGTIAVVTAAALAVARLGREVCVVLAQQVQRGFVLGRSDVDELRFCFYQVPQELEVSGGSRGVDGRPSIHAVEGGQGPGGLVQE
mmetsp:Transcript_3780/g.8238  ORF Transcript_3780/g.8238 Transcript_3780/m.8238 type:complete len:225 (-) Transcript_3780:632-1306(-)